MFRKALLLLSLIGLVGSFAGTATAQDTRSRAGMDALRERVNAGRVGVISGGVNGTYIRIAADLAAVLDNRNELRILPIIGKGSVQNITDILYLHGIDVGIVQSDVLAFMKSEGIHPTIEQRVRYITKLYNEEFHLLARDDIADVQGLAGKPVNFDVDGSGTNMTAGTVFRLLGIDVERTTFDQSLALEKLRTGEIAAMVYVAGKPTRLYDAVEPEAGLRFLPIPLTPELLETYLPARLEHEDYPRLIAEGESVDTVAVGAVMAVYNWASTHQRYRNVAAFVEAFFEAFDEFQQPPRHAKWREVNLAAEVPGWRRFSTAETWLAGYAERASQQDQVRAQAQAQAETERSFEEFLTFFRGQVGRDASAPISEDERRVLFQQYLEWRQRLQQ